MKRARPHPPERVNWFKALRIAVLLLVLLVVGLGSALQRYRSTRWREPLFVAIYPIAGDASPATRRYLDALDDARFRPIDVFFTREAAQHRLRTGEPVRTRLQPELTRLPPRRAQSAGVFGTALWSLELRYWAWRAARGDREPQDIRIFVIYHDPKVTPSVPHSLGLTKGLIGVVYAFADPAMDGSNDVVIAHELLHTVGATDKYDPGDDAPRFPDGYGDPHQVPLFPQRHAELMAGRRMQGPHRWVQSDSLDDVVIGPATALEIRWTQNAR